jgi:hypothetical protein
MKLERIHAILLQQMSLEAERLVESLQFLKFRQSQAELIIQIIFHSYYTLIPK